MTRRKFFLQVKCIFLIFFSCVIVQNIIIRWPRRGSSATTIANVSAFSSIPPFAHRAPRWPSHRALKKCSRCPLHTETGSEVDRECSGLLVSLYILLLPSAQLVCFWINFWQVRFFFQSSYFTFDLSPSLICCLNFFYAFEHDRLIYYWFIMICKKFECPSKKIQILSHLNFKRTTVILIFPILHVSQTIWK